MFWYTINITNTASAMFASANLIYGLSIAKYTRTIQVEKIKSQSLYQRTFINTFVYLLLRHTEMVWSVLIRFDIYSFNHNSDHYSYFISVWNRGGQLVIRKEWTFSHTLKCIGMYLYNIHNCTENKNTVCISW